MKINQVEKDFLSHFRGLVKRERMLENNGEQEHCIEVIRQFARQGWNCCAQDIINEIRRTPE